MKIGFLITARLKSTRLPKKLLLKINNLEIIRWMIRRLKLNHNLNEIVICTSTNPDDDTLEKIAISEKIKCFRGSEEDVIERLYFASKQFNFEFVINITADCPLVSYEYIDKVIDEFNRTKSDLIRTMDLPHGLYIYGLNVSALKKINEIKKETRTEVWGKLFTDTGLFKVNDIKIPQNLIRPSYRLTLDYPEDYEFFKKVFEDNGPSTYMLKDRQIIQYLDNNPDVVAINAHCEYLYKERWNRQGEIKI